MHDGQVKVITGIRRCGKSTLLFDLFYKYLIESGVDSTCIIGIQLDKRKYAKYRNPIVLSEYVEDIISNKKENFYLFIDEIQFCHSVEDPDNVGFEITVYDMLNELKDYKNLDVRHISKREFDHGRTRNESVKRSDSEYFLMMTQDAMPVDDKLVENLLAALKKDKPTIAVLGNGVDICYPSDHLDLYRAIINNGSVISEYPPGARATRYSFPERNKIIAGLSDELYVIGSGKKSGSLITASFAEKYEKTLVELSLSIALHKHS